LAHATELAFAEVSPPVVKAPGVLRRVLGRWIPLLVLIVILAIGWEAIKFIGGQVTPIEFQVFGQKVETVWKPPLKWQFANDLNMPHLWDVIGAFSKPAQRGGDPLLIVLLNSAFYTFRVALLGFAIGSIAGLLIAILFIHSRLLGRAFIPYIIASQTIPILVIAPIVVIWLQGGALSVAIIAAYLTFFPVTISALRGLRSATPEMMELMRTYGASPRQILLMLRLPASVSYLFVGFKIAATSSILGTIVGELPSGISEGLGIAILNFAQYYTTGPAKLWACILIAALLGISTYLLVHLAESIVLRNRPRAAQ